MTVYHSITFLNLTEPKVDMALSTFVTSARGTKLLILDEYTYYKNGVIKNGSRFVCSSKKSRGCRAYLHIDKNDDTIIAAYTDHNHTPTPYIVTKSGNYVRIGYAKQI
ncbi:hypothetical protein ABMA28_001375 [Loxostege sticticalis]|uniref:FLYWCH-type domain-containing protein n=1 Tax=Loxostege sticticalis TaxID=481309 RepID=A0ABD0T1M9_LOXSC